jgi:hypothetical protein
MVAANRPGSKPGYVGARAFGSFIAVEVGKCAKIARLASVQPYK